MPNMLSQLGGQGGINANDMQRLQAMQKEAELEAMLQQQRMADRDAYMQSMPTGTPTQGMTIRDYIAQSRAVMPDTRPMPRVTQSPFQNFLSMLMGRSGTDPRALQAGQAGAMGLNNQRIRMRLDDDARMQARMNMLDGR
jgi:hypothetical protein